MCKEEWRGKEEGNSLSGEQLKKRRSGGLWRGMGGVVPHRTCVTVC